MKKKGDNYDEKFEKLENLLVKFISQSVPAGTSTAQPISINTPPATMTSEDHNLLLRIDTKVERVIQDVADLRNNFSNRVDALEREKEDQKNALERHAKQEAVNRDIELRARRLEQWGSMGLGALFIIQIVLKFFIQ